MKGGSARSALMVVAALMLLMVAQQSMRPEPPERTLKDVCRQKTEPERSVATCTALIDDLSLTAAERVHALRPRGRAYGRLQRYPEAVADSTAALEIAPRRNEPLEARAAAFLQTAAFDAARADLDRAIAGDPGRPGAWLLRGRLNRALDRIDATIADLAQARAISGQDHLLHRVLLLRTGQTDAVHAILRPAFERFNSSKHVGILLPCLGYLDGTVLDRTCDDTIVAAFRACAMDSRCGV